MASARRAGAGQRARFHGQAAGQGDPVRRLRCGRRRRMGQRGHRSRHRRIRRRHHRDLVAQGRIIGLPARVPAADHRRRRRLQRLPHPAVEDRAGPACRAERADHHRGAPAAGGGSTGYRTRLWKTELAQLADQSGLTITVCHLPPGTSKWNKIEHRLFSHISMNWRGRPLTSHEVVVNTIAATTTRTGLTVTAELDTGSYPKGIKITDEQMRDVERTTLRRHEFHGAWNYTLAPGWSGPP